MTVNYFPAIYRGTKLICPEFWAVCGVGYRDDAARRLLRQTFKTEAEAKGALAAYLEER